MCIRCNEQEAVGDAAAYEYSTGLDRDPDTTYNYPSSLDDHCEDCLDGGLKQMKEDAEQDRYDDSREERDYYNRFGG
jgi:hypothetical protein